MKIKYSVKNCQHYYCFKWIICVYIYFSFVQSFSRSGLEYNQDYESN